MKASVLPTTTNSDSSSRSRRWLQGNGLLLRALVLFTVLGFGVWIGTLLRKEPSSSTASVGLDFFNICNDHEEIKTTPLCQRLLQVTGSHLGSERKNWNHASIVDFVKLASEVHSECIVVETPKSVVGKTNSSETATATCPANSLLQINNHGQQLDETATQNENSCLCPPAQTPDSSSSKTSRYIWFLITAGFVVVKIFLALFLAKTVHEVLGQRFVFVAWVVFPWLWFFSNASALYICTWYLVSDIASKGLISDQIMVPRAFRVLLAGALLVIYGAWFLLKMSERELMLWVFLYLVFTVPLDPILDYWIETKTSQQPQ